MKLRTYTDLSLLDTFAKRFEYLQIGGTLGAETFGGSRYINQWFYTSAEWRRIRDFVILRDAGCDLGIPGLEINGRILVHHMNPISEEDIIEHSDRLVLPEFLICTSERTHNAIHFGDKRILDHGLIERRPNDTIPWRK